MSCRCKTQEEHAARAVEQSNYSRQAADDLHRRQAQDREAVNAKRIRELAERSPNPDEFKIVDYAEAHKHLVLRVRYPSCVRCSYDQCKVMVFFSVTMKQALRWTRIDPHFREAGSASVLVTDQAPSPAARFPASAEGWADAVAYAERKSPK